MGKDGAFYGTTNGSGTNGSTVYRITSAGVYSTVGVFANVYGGPVSVVGLTQGPDGSFYGAYLAHALGLDPTSSISVFRLTASGEVTNLHTFTDDTGYTFFPTATVLGQDGKLYGAVCPSPQIDLTYDGFIYSLGLDGSDYRTLYTFTGGLDGGEPAGLTASPDGTIYGLSSYGGHGGIGTIYRLALHPAFFNAEQVLSDGVYYLAFPSYTPFGYYSYLTDQNYIYHFDLGYEYVFDANDGKGGVYFYDFTSNDFFYTSPTFPFPYLYDFSLNTVLYYYPDPNNPGHYNTDGVRYFYDFDTRQIISK